MSKINQLIDAVKTAASIHKGDYSSLRGKSFLIRANIKKKRRGKHVKKSKGEKITLAKLAEEMRAGFKQVNTRLDYIVKANNLKDLSRNK